MAKYHGMVGFVETVETRPGVWKEMITEREACGDLIRNTRSLETTSQLNANININNQISIVADAFFRDHIYAMRYVTFQGAKWKVTNVDVQYPRLILSVGGLYNGET